MVSFLVLYHLLLFQIFTFHTGLQRYTICDKNKSLNVQQTAQLGFYLQPPMLKLALGLVVTSQSPLWHHKGLTSRSVSLAHIFWKAEEKNGTPFQVWGVDWQDTCIFWKRSIILRNNWTNWDYHKLAALLSHHRLLHGWLLRFKLIKFILILFLTKWPISNINQKPDEWGQLVRSAKIPSKWSTLGKKNKVIKKEKRKKSIQRVWCLVK